MSTGSFIGGIMFERVGGSSTFRIYGIAVLAFCVLHIGVQKLLQRYSNVNGKNGSESGAIQTESARADGTMTKSDLLLTGKENVDEKGN